MRIIPRVLRCFGLFLDDIWYYRFHRTQYPDSAHLFMDKVDIINDFRLSPWILNSINFFNNINFGQNYQTTYNQLISHH